MPFRFLERFRRPAQPPQTGRATRVAAERLSAWAWLDADGRDRLVSDADDLADALRWEAARGFEIDEEIRSTIAVHGALLTLELGPDCYRNVSSVIVHPSTIEMHGEHSVAPGLMADDPVDLAGEAHHMGPVLISWDAARHQADHPGRGHNVIFHEFAHQLDMLDGWVDGTPPLESSDQRSRWIRVCTEAYERLREGDTAGGVLDAYGAEDPGEFFAVATEAFFGRPVDLARRRPELYEAFASYYRQDPARILSGLTVTDGAP